MPGSTLNWNVNAIAKGPGKLWAGLAVPAVGSKLKLHTDGTPDSTQNPNAKHLGMTEAGSQFLEKPTVQDFFADEFLDPILSSQTATELAISGNLLQVADFDLLEILTIAGTRADGAGYDMLTYGGKSIIEYESVAVIFPLQSNPALFGVFHLYKAVNDQGMAVEIGAKKLGSTPFAFKGKAITSRPAGDTTGAYWIQESVGS